MYFKNERFLNIRVPSTDQSNIYLTYNKNDSIQSIKEKLVQHTGIPLDSQILSYSGYAILDDASFEELIEYSGSCIIHMCLDIAVNGGADCIASFTAPDMTNDGCFEVRSFDTTGTAKYYNSLSKGINFEAYCVSPKCIALNKLVDIPLGMCIVDHGICDYAETTDELICPACNNYIDYKEVTNVCFVDCTVEVKYKISNAKGQAQKYEMSAPADKYLKLKDPENMLQYRFIKFTLK